MQPQLRRPRKQMRQVRPCGNAASAVGGSALAGVRRAEVCPSTPSRSSSAPLRRALLTQLTKARATPILDVCKRTTAVSASRPAKATQRPMLARRTGRPSVDLLMGRRSHSPSRAASRPPVRVRRVPLPRTRPSDWPQSPRRSSRDAAHRRSPPAGRRSAAVHDTPREPGCPRRRSIGVQHQTRARPARTERRPPIGGRSRARPPRGDLAPHGRRLAARSTSK